jgi:4'-phosphopantetheinyl transferase
MHPRTFSVDVAPEYTPPHAAADRCRFPVMVQAKSWIDVWRVRLEPELSRLQSHIYNLTLDERDHIARLRFPEDRARTIVSRSTRRCLLARALGVDARKIMFAHSAFGKPRLQWPRSDLAFNSSRSGDLILHALSPMGGIGVDLQAIAPLKVDRSGLAKMLADEERELLHTCPAHMIAATLAQIWARKEAYVKAIGEGLSYPLDFAIGAASDGKCKLLHDRWSTLPLAEWNFVDLDVGAAHAGCLAYHGPQRSIRIREFGYIRPS